MALAEERATTIADRRANARWLLSGNLGLLLTMMVLAFVTFGVWLLVGKQRNVVPTVVPQFYPPSALGPAAVRYIHRMGNTNKVKLLVTGLVSLAVKGSVTLEKQRIQRISPKESHLTPAEIGILSDLNLLIMAMSML